jgi:hypothetical protein
MRVMRVQESDESDESESDCVKGVGVTTICVSAYISMGQSEGRWGIGEKDSQVAERRKTPSRRGNMRVNPSEL